MSGSVKQILSATVLLVVLYLAFVHFTGFSSDVGALATGYSGAVKTLQGR